MYIFLAYAPDRIGWTGSVEAPSNAALSKLSTSCRYLITFQHSYGPADLHRWIASYCILVRELININSRQGGKTKDCVNHGIVNML